MKGQVDLSLNILGITYYAILKSNIKTLLNINTCANVIRIYRITLGAIFLDAFG